MTAKELKKYISDNDKFVDILEMLRMGDIWDNGNYISCSQPDGDNPTGTIVYKNETCNVNAYTRDIRDKQSDINSTDIINLTAFILNVTYKSAKNYLMNFLGLSNSKTALKKRDEISLFRKVKRDKERRQKQLNKEQIYYDISILNQYSNTFHIDLIKKDGLISQEILKKYYVMFDFRSERIIFPHFKWDDDSKICGIVGRTVNPSFKELGIKKYMSLLPTEYIKTSNFYGLCWNRTYIEEKRKIIIFESEKSVIKSDMFGYPFCVSVGLHDISDIQKKILLSLNIDEIIIAFDNDVEEEYMKEQCSKFNNFIKTSYIYDKWNLLGEKDSPVDKGRRKWRFLYNHRIVCNKKILK